MGRVFWFFVVKDVFCVEGTKRRLNIAPNQGKVIVRQIGPILLQYIISRLPVVQASVIVP